MAESCKVSFNYKFYIIKIGDKLPLAVRPKSVIKMIILKFLFY